VRDVALLAVTSTNVMSEKVTPECENQGKHEDPQQCEKTETEDEEG
jgi:hypothetical protein